jgi:HD-GYP domain-containing protein (c-di-GMP phosphodiesterase class II)/PAS domain-containing protein
MVKKDNTQLQVPADGRNTGWEKRYRELFNHILSGVAVYEAVENGEDFIIKDFNPAAESIEKVKREEIIGRKVSDVFPGIREMGLLDIFRKVWQTGNEEYHPISIYQDKRLMGWRENRIYKLANGEIAAIYEDRTEQKKIEEKMAWLASFPEVNPLIVVEVDGQFNVKYCNPAARKQIPEINDARKNHAFLQLVPKAVKELQNLKENMVTMEAHIGHHWYTQIVCRISNNPNFRIYAYNISERKRAEDMRQVLVDIMHPSVNADDLHEFLGLVHQSISKVLFAENFFTVLHHEDTGLFEEVYTVDQYDQPAPPSKLEKSVTAYVFHSGKPLLMNQAIYRNLIEKGDVEQVGKECPSWLGVPLLIGRKPVGVMVIQDYEMENRYTKSDADFLFSIAGEVAKLVERMQSEEKIRSSEKRFRSLFEGSPISLWEEDFSAVLKKLNEMSANGNPDIRDFLEKNPGEVFALTKLVNVVDINQATLSLYEAEKKEDLLNNIGQILADDHLEGFRSELVNIAAGAKHFSWEAVNRSLKGRLIDVGISWTAMPGHEEDLSRVLISIIDISQRKQSEREMQHLIKDLRILGEEEKNNRIFAEALARNALTLNSSLNTNEIMDAIIQNIDSVIPSDSLSIMLIEGDTFKFVRTKGYAEKGLAEWVQHKKFKIDEIASVADIIRTKKHILTSDCETDASWTVIAETAWIKSNIMAPLLADGRVIGFLNIDSTTRGFFNEENAKKLVSFTDQISTALKNAHLFEDLRKRMNRMQAMTQIDQAINSSLDLNISLEIILMQAREQLRADGVDILLVDDINQRLVFSKARGFKTDVINKTNLRLGTGLPGNAVLERSIVSIPDLETATESFFKNVLIEQEGFKSYYCVPLVTKGQLKGVMEIFFKQHFQADQEWLEFLGTLAQQSAIAINNAELLNSLQAGQFDLVNAYENALQGWSDSIENQIGGNKGNPQRVVEAAVKIAEKMGMNRTDLANFKRGAMLHDIGNAAIPASLLGKPGALTEDEWQIIRTHPLQARTMLTKSKYLANAMDIPCFHHEKWDGSGYPQGLKAEAIPLAARIYSVADAWDALTSDRPYRKAWSMLKTMKYIHAQSGIAFDPTVVNAFEELLEKKAIK